MLAGQAIVEIINIARAEAARIDPQCLAVGFVKRVGWGASIKRVDELRLPAIGVVDEAIAVSVGVHQRHQSASRVKDLGCPETVGIEQARGSASRVIDRGRDMGVFASERGTGGWRCRMSTSSGSAGDLILATGLSSLSKTLVVLKLRGLVVRMGSSARS